MAQFLPPSEPLYGVGQRLWFADGRSGLVVSFQFNPVQDEWGYFLDPLGGLFNESDLLDAPPAEPGPQRFVGAPPPTVEVVAGVTQEELRGAIIDAVNAANLTAQANIAAAIDALRDETALQFSTFLEQRATFRAEIVTQHSEIQDRQTALEAAATENDGPGLLGFVSGLGGFLRSPLAWFLDRAEAEIAKEVNDGLNR